MGIDQRDGQLVVEDAMIELQWVASRTRLTAYPESSSYGKVERGERWPWSRAPCSAKDTAHDHTVC